MARSKNATALFEVIHTAKKPPKSSPTVSVPTPKWWTKTKPGVVSKPPAAHDTAETAGKQGSWLAAAARRGVTPTAPRPGETFESSSNDEAAQAISTDDHAHHSEQQIADVPAEIESEQPTVAPKPRFAERFAERFARKAVAAAVAAPVEPVDRFEIPETPVETLDRHAEIFPEDPESPAMEMSPPARVSNTDELLLVDRAAKEVSFRLSYGGVISIGFVLVLILVLAFLIGLRYSNSLASAVDTKRPIDTDSSASLMAMTANPSAQSVPTTPATPAPATPSPAVPTPPLRSDVLSVTRHPAKPVVENPSSTPAPAATKAVPLNTVREVGTIYIVAQSYPERSLARKACDFLNKRGIPCSLVQGLDEWAPHDWYSVVGLVPFAAKDPNLAEYQRKITAMGQDFSTKVYNQFEPKPYPWRASSDSMGTTSSGDEADQSGGQ